MSDLEIAIKETLANEAPRLNWEWLAVHCEGYRQWRAATEQRQASEAEYRMKYLAHK